MPLVTVFPVFLVGILGIPKFAGLEGITADHVMPLLLTGLAPISPFLYLLSLMVLVGIIAAVMSTADSVLLSLSSIVTKDLLGKTWLRDASQEQLTRTGKRIAWFVMLILIILALSPRMTLWGLIELKMELLIQTAPLFILSVLWPRMTARGAMAGLVVGACLAAGLSLSGYGRVWGWHAGVIGLVVNVLICVAGSWRANSMKIRA